jgi:hypothetical protein
MTRKYDVGQMVLLRQLLRYLCHTARFDRIHTSCSSLRSKEGENATAGPDVHHNLVFEVNSMDAGVNYLFFMTALK